MERHARKSESVLIFSLVGLVGLLLGLGVLFSPGPAQAAHKLKEDSCGKCHSVSGAVGKVVPYTKLIKKNDLRIVEIQGASGVLVPWTGGNELPCIYCHQDDTGTRTHMIGVKGHFSAANLAKHDLPANTYLVSSNNGAQNAQLDCVDCHKSVEYVGKGTVGDFQNPNIHSKDTLNVAWTGAVAGTTGLLLVNQTFQASPYNSVGNSLCRTLCHNGVSLNSPAAPRLHGYARTTISLEGKNGFTITVGGCLYNGVKNTGCHGTHGSSDTGLLALEKTGGGVITSNDCGICHAFDDPRPPTYQYVAKGHGGQTITACVECHNPMAAHFTTGGKPVGTRLFSEGSLNSTFSSPHKSALSDCQKCHSTMGMHSPSGVIVGCLDCHEPHGKGIGTNIKMIRLFAPVSAPGASIHFTTTGPDGYWNSATAKGVYSNRVCDSQACHGVKFGPMSSYFAYTGALPTVNNSHPGGTGHGYANCSMTNCHQHKTGGDAWAAPKTCDACHATLNGTGTAHTHPGENGTTHNTIHAKGFYISDCTDCHNFTSTSGPLHQNGTVNFGGARMGSLVSLDYPLTTGFSATTACAKNKCHDADAGEWKAGNLGTNSCANCHLAAATRFMARAPSTGLHKSSFAVTVKAHNQNLFALTIGGAGRGCVTCHTATPSTKHQDGTLDLNTAIIAFAGSVGQVASPVGTPSCMPKGVRYQTCHSDQGNWRRDWDKAAQSLSTNATAPRCRVCHGVWGYWNAGTSHYNNDGLAPSSRFNTQGQVYHTTANCDDCHAYTTVPNQHDTAVHRVQVNNNATGFTVQTGQARCNACHSTNDVQHTFPASLAFAFSRVTGPPITSVCNSCHGSVTNGQYWPKGSGGTPGYADSWPGSAARHKTHIWAITQYKWSSTPGGMLNRPGAAASQKYACTFCHGSAPGLGGHPYGAVTRRAFLATPGLWRRFTGATADGIDANSLAYSKLTLVCQNLVCHNLQNSPATANSNWRGTTGYNPPSTQAECQTLCHKVEYAIPHKTGHARHVSVKGYACERCHPSHISPSTDFRHLSGQVGIANTTMNAIRNPGGYAGYVGTYTAAVAGQVANFSGTGQCVGLYCHGRVKSARWGSTYTANQCTACHTAGGSQTSDPVSGLHKSAFAITVKGHDQNLFASTIGGAGNGCVACHTLSPNARGAANHVDGFMSTKYVSATAGVAIYGSVVPSAGLTVGCATKGVRYQTCHSDQGNWTRDWDIAANSQSTNATAVRCRVCHGVWGYWNAGTSHYRNDGLNANSRLNSQGQVYHTTANCDDCHAYVAVPNQHDTAVHLVNVNSTGTGFTVTAGQTRCNACHATNDVQHTFPTSLAFAFSRVAGAAIPVSCTACHGNVANGQFWPKGSGGIPGYADSWPNSAARHKTHINAITMYKWASTPAGMLSRPGAAASQKYACTFCHGSAPGLGGHPYGTVTRRAFLATAGLWRQFTGGTADGIDANSQAYSKLTFVCQNLVCHNRQNSPATAGSNWRQGAWVPTLAGDCLFVCHKAENYIPYKTGHAAHVSQKGYTCVRCHPNNGTTFRHESGTIGFANTIGTFGKAGYVGTYTAANAARQVAYVSGTGRCTALYCHGRLTTPSWSLTIAANGCVACHTPGGAQASDPQTNGLHTSSFALTVKAHNQNLFALTIGGAGNGCVTCHTITPNATAKNHVDGIMSTKYVSPTSGVAINGSVFPAAATSVGCTPKGGRYQTCHSDLGNWTRDWDRSANSLSTNATAPRCRVCHGVWGYWSIGTSHYRNDGLAPNSRANTQGQVYHTTANCDDCHAYTTVPNQHDTAVHRVQVNNNATGFTVATGQTRCNQCHTTSDVQHTFPTSLAFAFSRVNGPPIVTVCTSCHGNVANGQYWPKGSGGVPGYADSWPNSAARHKTHINAITMYKWASTPAGMLSRPGAAASQKYACTFCHGSAPGLGGHPYGTVTRRAFLATAGLWRQFTGGTADGIDANSQAYSKLTFVCQNLVCHNRQNSPATAGSNWRQGAWVPTLAGDCLFVCHKAENYIPYQTGHAQHVGSKGYTCVRCHPNNGTTFRHESGMVGFANTLGTFGKAGYVGTYTAANAARQVAYTSGTGQCTALYCHGGLKSARWSSTYTASQCTACHSSGNAVSGPTSGLHNITTAGVQHHDQALFASTIGGAGYGCVTCHTTLPNARSAANHVDGFMSTKYVSATAGVRVYASVFPAVATTTGCAPKQGRYQTCHSDLGNWTRDWDNAADSAVTAATSTRCKVCHGVWGSWNIGTSHYRNDGLNANSRANTQGQVQHTGADCNDCHAYLTVGGQHDVAPHLVQVNGNGSGFTVAAGQARCNQCHTTSDVQHTFPTSLAFGFSRVPGPAISGGSCLSCHPALIAHTRRSRTSTTRACTACHPGTLASTGISTLPANPYPTEHNKNASANVFFIPNATQPANANSIGPHVDAAHGSGIYLGGYATVGTTEADMCWNCHDTYPTRVSEWGTNTQQQAFMKTYNSGKMWAGALTTSRWVRSGASGAQALTWTSRYSVASGYATSLFDYKTGKIRSTHSANAGSGVSGVDLPRWIRCSYCHDVHNTQGPNNGSYLRGRWRGNPYLEDGAPRAIVTYANVSGMGNVPRGMKAKNVLGGWQIDENNTTPTAGSPGITAWAQLCAYCHQDTVSGAPTGNGVWTSVQIKAINISAGTKSPGGTEWKTGAQFNPSPGTGALVGQINGHGAVMLSGGRSNARNIYSESMRQRRGSYTTGNGTASNPIMMYLGLVSARGYGFRSQRCGGNLLPSIGAETTIATDLTATADSRTLNYPYHKFPCSKCHNPHASRLPRLMITNCLDTKHNTWDNVRAGVSLVNAPSGGFSANQSVTFSQVTAAANCHRLRDPLYAKPSVTPGGWNSITPW